MELSITKLRPEQTEEPSEEDKEASNATMDPAIWGRLHGELVDRILLCLPIANLYSLRCVSKSWDTTIKSTSFNRMYLEKASRGPSWLFMCSSFNCRDFTSAYDPVQNRWHNFPLTFLPSCMRFPLTAVGGRLFVRGGLTNAGVLVVCNPMTRSWRVLPPMIHRRLNSLVGVYEDKRSKSYKIVVAGGTSESGGEYECTTEVYDSLSNSWKVTGKVRREITVRITWWTSKTVFCNGVLYCLTSGRPYSVIAYDLKTATWDEVAVPPPEFLFCTFLIQRRNRLFLVGGAGTERICEHVHMWELKQVDGEGKQWVEVEKMPHEYFQIFFKERTATDLKCSGHGDLVYFYKDSHTQFNLATGYLQVLVCDFSKKQTEWRWLPKCPLSMNFLKFSIRGLFLDPTLDASV
ncbi:F-box/kelch-repeat protein At5g15710 isoform X1 [Physcomitrium patens]|uniref:F-box domain-containing protein n=1 Tax=Physcomitrium patens TaxID=3218 RepID=A0A7I4CC02_PHYPA|nr:F-box/kelch-repeat protein At5g15710-like isoform X2 [Physcomitrium patens]|eukprot:XP_024361156.1 F-box/kelch-repeat protein At5g15710-like isoform X2 [Physcomitrella patens]